SESIRQRYKASLNSLSKNFRDLIEGKLKLPIISLEQIGMDMIKNIHDASSEIVFGDFGMKAISKTNPNHVFGVNSEGWYISQDGGATPRTIATAQGIYADALFAGTLWLTSEMNIESFDGHINITGDGITVSNKVLANTYTKIENGYIESRGTHSRTWLGTTTESDVSLRHEDGYIRARNNTEEYSLYFSDYGISTYADAEGNNDASGSLLFRETEYSDTWGVTLHSTYGAVALKSEYSTVHLDADNTVNIGSRNFSIYARPFQESRPGLNEFQLYVKESQSSSETDGAILFGNITGGATHGSGIRLSKSGSEPKIYATNVNGDIGTGGLHGKYVQAESISVLDEGANLYLGTSTGEVRVTNNLLYNGGDIGYKPIKASAFTQASSETYKTNIEDVGDIGLETIKGLNVVEYNLIDDIEEGVTDNRQIGLIAEDSAPVATKDLTGIDLYKMASYSIKAIQELEAKVKALEAK